jgi:site-specific DNA-methyltransferase (adenine-specific)
MWIYSSGFPKSQDIGKSIERSEKKRADNALGIKRSKIESGPKTNCPKCNKTLNGTNQTLCQEEQCDLRDALAPADNEWAGWGTALKPAHEPIALARKPIKLSIAKNCQQYGVGALNIDATRIASDPNEIIYGSGPRDKDGVCRNRQQGETFGNGMLPPVDYDTTKGRFPSNVLGDIPDYQKYFYCPKVSRRERHIGFAYAETNKEMCASIGVEYKDNETQLPGIGMVKDHGLRQEIEKIRGYSSAGNNHPTVKPIELMKYLIKLITPPGGTVLDPFNGSGSTGCAAVELGHTYIGCELDPAYVEISQKRIAAWTAQDNKFDELFE